MRGKRSTVVLFIRGLPSDVSNKELKTFIRKTLKESGLRSQTIFSESVGDCNILRITDPQTGQIEFHGLIEIRPAVLAMRAIDVLNETKFRESPLETRRYRQRSPLERGDGQGAVSNPSTAGPENPQKEEQRRAALKIDLVESDVPGLSPLAVFSANHRFADR